MRPAIQSPEREDANECGKGYPAMRAWKRFGAGMEPDYSRARRRRKGEGEHGPIWGGRTSS